MYIYPSQMRQDIDHLRERKLFEKKMVVGNCSHFPRTSCHGKRVIKPSKTMEKQPVVSPKTRFHMLFSRKKIEEVQRKWRDCQPTVDKKAKRRLFFPLSLKSNKNDGRVS